jgi:hypothetical protein
VVSVVKLKYSIVANLPRSPVAVGGLVNAAGLIPQIRVKAAAKIIAAFR